MGKKIIFILLASLLLMVILERLCRSLVLGNPNIKTSYIRERAIKADILALGSSNVMYMLNPERFREKTGYKMYNLAGNHASIDENLASLHLYLEKNPPPRCIVLGITLPDIAVSGSSFHSWFFTPFLGDALIDSLVAANDPGYYRYVGIPFLRYAYYNQFFMPYCLQTVYKAIAGRTGAYSPDGYFMAPDEGRGFEGFEKMKRLYPKGVEYKWTIKDSLALERLLHYAQGKGVRVIGFETPYLTESGEIFKGRDRAVSALRKQFEHRGSGYLTFDTLEICRSRRYFVSVFHTNPQGSEIFTEALAEALSEEIRKD